MITEKKVQVAAEQSLFSRFFPSRRSREKFKDGLKCFKISGIKKTISKQLLAKIETLEDKIRIQLKNFF